MDASFFRNENDTSCIEIFIKNQDIIQFKQNFQYLYNDKSTQV